MPVAPAAATELLGRSGQALFVEARTADAIGDEARAARLFSVLSARDPANSELAQRTVSTAIQAGETELAMSVVRRMAPDTLGLDGRLLLVADWLARGRADQALGVLNERTSDSDGGFLAPVLRGWAEQQARIDGSARLANIAPGNILAPFAAEQRAAMLLADKKVAEALPLIDQALEVGGRRAVRLRLAFAIGLAKAGDFTRARALLVGEDPALRLLDLDRPQRGLAIDSPAAGYAHLLTGLAIGLARGEDRTLPLTLVQVARHAAPASSEAAMIVALLLEQRDRGDAALAVLARIPADDPFAEEALDASARLLLAGKKGGEALALSQKAVSRRGATAADHARLGNVLDELDRPAEAVAAYARAAAMADAARAPDRWTFRLLGAAQLDKLKRWPEARAQLELGLKAAPDQPLLLNYLGYNSVERGENLDAAEAMIRRALALRPDDASITDSLGWALYKRGRLPEAIETLQKASLADPAQSEINEHLGDALYRAGRRFEARFAWRAALVTAEKAPERARIEAKIAAGWTLATAAP